MRRKRKDKTPNGTGKDKFIPGNQLHRSPIYRRLRGYAFDPSLSTQFDTAVINATTYKINWEFLTPGPVGEYLEVVDYDPASGCFYEPVDLDDPFLLAQDGLLPSEGNPQFHQQMVYAVCMLTINNFERALGRPALWRSHSRNFYSDSEFLRRLRIYPHAMRQANAYYSPHKQALLFGYFPAPFDQPGRFLPGGIVFTCLSHDIIAHETTHALLDGMYSFFNEPTNPDVLAFHEAFADIVALFQHFTFPEVLRDQINRTRGDLASQNFLGELAQQFGEAIGNYGALRNAIGEYDENGKWRPSTPDPLAYETTTEPHERGAILVAAVFDAFLSIYKSRIVDLLRIASSGTGILPEGALHPDLVNRLSREAAKTAQHVLNMCIRALDYCPPVEVSFGDYLRAIITADFDLFQDDDKNYRIAFIEAFRRRGIYPRSVRTLSVESLRWPLISERQDFFRPIARRLREFADQSVYFRDRQWIFQKTRHARCELHDWISRADKREQEMLSHFVGVSFDSRSDDLDKTNTRSFAIHNLRPIRRVGPDGTSLNQLMFSITQSRELPLNPTDNDKSNLFGFRSGCTLILDLREGWLQLRYAIKKDIADETRLELNRHYRRSLMNEGSLRATYFKQIEGPFASLHRGFDEGRP